MATNFAIDRRFAGSTADGSLQLPAANQYCLLFDTTRLPYGRGLGSTAYTLASSMYSADKYRGEHTGVRVHGNIYCTSQNMTVRFYYLRADGTFDTTSEIADSTLTAGTAKIINWFTGAYGSDFAIVAIAGGTPPGAIYCDLWLGWDISSGA